MVHLMHRTLAQNKNIDVYLFALVLLSRPLRSVSSRQAFRRRWEFNFILFAVLSLDLTELDSALDFEAFEEFFVTGTVSLTWFEPLNPNLLCCFILLQQVKVPEWEALSVPHFFWWHLFIVFNDLMSFCNKLGRDFSTDAVFWDGLPTRFNFLEGNLECTLEWSARLALLHCDNDSFAVLYGLLVYAAVLFNELVATYGHAGEGVCCLLTLSSLHIFHR